MIRTTLEIEPELTKRLASLATDEEKYDFVFKWLTWMEWYAWKEGAKKNSSLLAYKRFMRVRKAVGSKIFDRALADVLPGYEQYFAAVPCETCGSPGKVFAEGFSCTTGPIGCYQCLGESGTVHESVGPGYDSGEAIHESVEADDDPEADTLRGLWRGMGGNSEDGELD